MRVCAFLFGIVRQEAAGALFLRVLDELPGRALLHHHAAVHEQDAVGHVTGKVHLVGHDDHGGLAVGQVPQNAQHLAGQLRVQRAGRLVEAEDIRVVMTRETDTGLYDEDSQNKKAQDMQKRILLIQKVDPVLTVSIHQNSYEDPAVKGPQVFYYRDSAQGEALAKKIQEKLNENLEVERPREIKGNTTYYLLKRSPGVLNIVECGFLTNPEEAASLSSEEYQEKVAQAIADGVKEYIEETL